MEKTSVSSRGLYAVVSICGRCRPIIAEQKLQKQRTRKILNCRAGVCENRFETIHKNVAGYCPSCSRALSRCWKCGAKVWMWCFGQVAAKTLGTAPESKKTANPKEKIRFDDLFCIMCLVGMKNKSHQLLFLLRYGRCENCAQVIKTNALRLCEECGKILNQCLRCRALTQKAA